MDRLFDGEPLTSQNQIMAYEIELVESAVEDYNSLDARGRSTVRQAMEVHLRHDPTKESRSRIKRLRGINHPQYRLRVDDYRIFYDVDGTTVSVLAVVKKSDAETWLNKNAEKTDDPSTSE